MNAAQPPSRPTSAQDYQDSAWVNSAFRPLLIGILSTSVISGPLAILQANTDWRLSYVLPLALAASLEGTYSTIQLGRPRWRNQRGVAFRLGEIALWLLLARLAVWAFSVGLPDLTQVALWLRHPARFFDGQFIASGVLLSVAWALSVGITSDFLDLALRADEIAAHNSHDWSDSRSQWRVFRPVPRSAIVGRLGSRWVYSGVFLVICAAVSRLEVSTGPRELVQIGIARLPLPTEILAALLCYFVAGLLLMSQARLAVLRGHWYNSDLQVGLPVLKRWHVNSVLTVLLIAGVAALLPIGSTGWLATVLEMAIAFLMRITYVLISLLAFLLTLLLYPLRLLFGQQERHEPPSAPQAKLDIPTQQQVASRLPDWLGGAVLWVVVALIFGYFMLNYLRARGLLDVPWLSWLQRLRYWWRARWDRFRATAQAAATALRRRLPTARMAGTSRLFGRPIQLSTLTPRDRIRYFYLRALSRAADRGLVRPSHKTPLEFVPDLTSQWPEADIDVQALTEAFLAARYTRRPIVAAEAHSIQGIWRRLMRTLRGQRPGSIHESGEDDRTPLAR